MSQAQSNAPLNSLPARTFNVRRVFTAPLFLGLGFVTIHLLDNHLPGAIWFAMPGKMLGWVPIFLGTSIGVVGLTQFARRGTTIMPRRESNALVTTGLYRWSRNPMYVGQVLVLIGLCVIAGSATVWGVPIVFALLIDRFLIRVEERMLLDRFGEDYRAYCRRVRRWV